MTKFLGESLCDEIAGYYRIWKIENLNEDFEYPTPEENQPLYYHIVRELDPLFIAFWVRLSESVLRHGLVVEIKPQVSSETR